MERIGVFCSSHPQLPPALVQATEALGRWIGSHGKMLVYGGVSKGLMEVLARSVKSAGGRVMGVVPFAMVQQGLVSGCVDLSFPVADLSDRKATMLREAEVFVALPGGIGTLDEVFTLLASAQVHEHTKRLIFFNPDGYWEGLLSFLSQSEQQGYLYPGTVASLVAPRTLPELLKNLE